MIGIFFTDEPVINYDAAKSSNLQFFAAYYREMVEQGVFYRHLNSKVYSYRQYIVMLILKRRLQRPKLQCQN